jgi:hypothetical protein
MVISIAAGGSFSSERKTTRNAQEFVSFIVLWALHPA